MADDTVVSMVLTLWAVVAVPLVGWSLGDSAYRWWSLAMPNGPGRHEPSQLRVSALRVSVPIAGEMA